MHTAGSNESRTSCAFYKPTCDAVGTRRLPTTSLSGFDNYRGLSLGVQIGLDYFRQQFCGQFSAAAEWTSLAPSGHRRVTEAPRVVERDGAHGGGGGVDWPASVQNRNKLEILVSGRYHN